MSTSDERARVLEHFSPEHSPLIEIGQRIGPDALNAVLEVLGGQKPHIPKAETFWASLEREIRNERIRARFMGNNHQELADESGLDVRQIYYIVHGRQR